MKLFIFLLMEVLLFLPLRGLAADGGIRPTRQDQKQSNISEASKAFGNLPLYFIENRGQVNEAVIFYEKGAGHAAFFTEKGVALSLTRGGDAAGHDLKHSTETLTLTFINANERPEITSDDEKTGKINYFIGNDKSRWLRNIPSYGALTYYDVYRNIDIKFYGKNENIEHDVIVRPGGDPSVVKFAYEGVKGLKITEEGDLEVSLSRGKLIQKRPLVYQEVKGERVVVEGGYRLLNSEDKAFAYGFTVAAYDRTKELVIDPVIDYSTYLGGVEHDVGMDMAVDDSGSVYITGSSASADFPLVSPIYGRNTTGPEIFVTKLNPAGSAIVYSTYLGGTMGGIGEGIAVDSTGAAYVTGWTYSTDFPLVNPVLGYGGNGDAFVTKLNPAGSALAYSTYLGGSGTDSGRAIAVNASGSAFITGDTDSDNFPQINSFGYGVYMGSLEAFVTRLGPDGGSFIYSSLLGGSGWDQAHGITVDSNDYALVTGRTSSADFPVQNAVQGSMGGQYDAFVTRVNPTGSNPMSYSTYLGGSGGDYGYGVAVDVFGNAYVTGDTLSTDFPVVNAIQPANAGIYDAFVTKITTPYPPAIAYSTYLGGIYVDHGYAVAVDAVGSAAVTGSTNSPDFPLLSAVQGVYGGGRSDAFLTRLDPAGSAMLDSTYLGGGDKDIGRGVAVLTSTGAAYLTGETWSADFPLLNPIQASRSNFNDAFISKISGTPPPVVYLTMTPDTSAVVIGSTLGYNVTAVNTTAARQCFNYWENVTLPNSSTYPPTGALFGPVHLCLNAGAMKTAHQSHGVPISAPIGAYAFNAFTGAYPSLVVSKGHFNFDVLGIGLAPSPHGRERSWRILENGFRE